MRSIRFFILIFCVATFSCSRPSKPAQETVLQKEKSFFVPIPIAKYSSTQAPCVDMQIDGKTFSMELDTGLRGDLSLGSTFVEQIASKTFLRTNSMYGMRGKEYATNLYRLPKVKVGAMSFIEPILQEDSEESRKDSVFVPDGKEPSPQEPGRLGWELFYTVNLLLDFKNSQIAFCDSLRTLQEEGFPIESFTKTPLFLERGLVEFDVTTPDGPLRCMLDTGATFNFLNTELEGGKTIEEVMWDEENAKEYPSFKIGGKDFGSVEFTQIPIKIPIHVEAILGMEFIREHLIFIDFANRQIYLRAYE